MSLRKPDSTRRTVLKALVAAPVAAVAFNGRALAAPLVTADDPMAQALAYTEKSEKADQSCSNCALYQGGEAPQGGCLLFPGKDVLSTGWCKSWALKS